MLDAFDFTILTFVLIDIQQSFSVNKALAGLLGTVTLLFRVVGGIGAGTIADRYGRKGPILFSIAWFTLFAVLSGASTSHVMLFAFRGLFGIGMGGMWAAGMPLALEHWPQHLRGIASGILQGGYSAGFLLSSLVYQLGYPLIRHEPEWAWRVMLWSGVIPALVVFAVMWTVPESPIWLEQQRKLAAEVRALPHRPAAGRRHRPARGHGLLHRDGRRAVRGPALAGPGDARAHPRPVVTGSVTVTVCNGVCHGHGRSAVTVTDPVTTGHMMRECASPSPSRPCFS